MARRIRVPLKRQGNQERKKMKHLISSTDNIWQQQMQVDLSQDNNNNNYNDIWL